MLEAAGYEIVPFNEPADVYVVNTCSVTNMADRKSRQMLHKAKKITLIRLFVATGCYVQTSEQEALEDLSIDIVIGNNRKHELVSLIEEFAKDNVLDINHEKQEFEELFVSLNSRAYEGFHKSTGWLQSVFAATV